MKGYEEARASSTQRTIKIQEGNRQVVALRRLLLRQLGTTFYDYQTLVSTKIIKAAVRGGNNEITLMWPRRSGKTEMLVDTALTIGLYWIHMQCQSFTIALVNPARTEQGVMVTRQRLKDNVAKIEGWLTLTMGVEPVLGDGRKTPDYVLHDSSGAECQVRAISANPSAHPKGAGFSLLFLEQVEEIDETTMKEIIFPMAEGEQLEQTLVLAGNPSYKMVNDYYRRHTLNLEYPLAMDWKICSQYRPTYKQLALMKMHQMGEESDEFKTQFACEWIVERRKPFANLITLMPKAYVSDPVNLRSVGADNAKDVDFTVITVMERQGADKIILDWLELQGNDYQEQAGLTAAFLRPHIRLGTMLSDATGQQDAIVEDQRNACRGICQVQGLKLTVETNDLIYKNYQREIQHGRLFYADAPPPNASEERRRAWFRCRDHFIEQHTDVERLFVANKMKLKAPERKGAHDDFVTSGALALHAMGLASSAPEAAYAG